ncbi:hypothetical protein HDU93_006583, partial [Gonapodya sp. JEL0774]
MTNDRKAEALLRDYIEAYNSRSITRIRDHLDPDCKVFFDGKLAHSGRHSMLPTYTSDWEAADAKRPPLWPTEDSMVDIVGALMESSKCDEGGPRIRVTLWSKILDMDVDVTYMWNEDVTMM